ncbi:hypothetical protein K1T71_011834 [Dendrolimus kikuchii]|uniref:Uncharacterized protein n=1 Tax=Dendrolimus kikuchii TaxID=765133 RepID=A0ACC1CM95_9NEOP|nr:hypothetical protein K1T71_011834 [Dendrolimus kikuchii]
MIKILIIATLANLVLTDNTRKFFSPSLETEPSISILYARDKKSDKITNECLTEMYPRNLYKYPLHIDRNDVPCIIHCVLKKFGIMTNDGLINIKNYYRRVQAIHRYDPRILISDVGETCAQNINDLIFPCLLISTTYAKISVMYAHDKLTDIVAEQCLNEMYPKAKHIEVQESDEPCIIFCVLKKFGIMNTNGVINLEIYRKRLNHKEQRNVVGNSGNSCAEAAEATQHKQDVCKKAKVFNDCTHLYRILL